MGMAYARQALEMAHNLGETELEMTARRIIVGSPSLRGSDLSSAVQSLEQLLARTEERGDLAEAGECCFNLAVAYYRMAEIRLSYKVSLHRIALIERCRQPYQLRTAYTWQVLLFASQGKWTEAQLEIERARPVVEHLASPLPCALLRQCQGFLAYQRENYIVAERELEAALALMGENLQNGLGDMMYYLGLLSLVQATLDVVKAARFSQAFTFQYSKRPGTPAAELGEQLPKAVVQERYDRLIALQDQIALEENRDQIGRTVELLVATGEGRKDSSTARMSGRARDGRLVHFAPGEHQVRPGDIVTTTVTRAAPHHLIADGDIINYRRTRAGDAHAAGQRPRGTGPSGDDADGGRVRGGARPLSLGMPAVGQPAAAAETPGCAR